MKTHEIRKSFLDFFVSKGHEVVPSSSLIPHNDPTLYFVNAGMVPFKDYFTGAEAAPWARATSAQKCLRVSGKHNDLDNVGRTPRHHTFFEMLGNFSFGDYFKDQAIPWAWELLTEVWGIEADKLWVTIYNDDDEAFAIWHEGVGVAENRIQRLGDKDNFWSMGATGPCGPCSEIHYDHGPEIDAEEGGPATESDRYVEIWNNVFMQFDQSETGRTELPKPSIDTGMGLERVAAVLQGVYWNYDTDGFQPLIQRAAELAGTAYGRDDKVDVGLRVIADHARASAFLVSDGIMPSNSERGYVLRRIMRRAITFGYQLGLEAPFLHDVCASVVSAFGDTYPELNHRSAFIHEVVHAEEERFYRTLSRGMKLLDDEFGKLGRKKTLPGRSRVQALRHLWIPLGFDGAHRRRTASKKVDRQGLRRRHAEAEGPGPQGVEGIGRGGGGRSCGTQLHAEHGDTAVHGLRKHRGYVSTILALVRRKVEVSQDDNGNDVENFTYELVRRAWKAGELKASCCSTARRSTPRAAAR